MGGQRINDHNSWVGKAGEHEVFPTGCKVRKFSSSEGAGDLKNYEQTSEQIEHMQDMSERDVNRQKRKDYRRN